MKWLEQSNIFTSTWFSSAQNSFITKFLVISATRFAELIQFWQDPKCRRNRTFWRKKLGFHWRKISYFVFIYFPLVLLFIPSFLFLTKTKNVTLALAASKISAKFGRTVQNVSVVNLANTQRKTCRSRGLLEVYFQNWNINKEKFIYRIFLIIWVWWLFDINLLKSWFLSLVWYKPVSFVLPNLLLHSLYIMTCICGILYYSIFENVFNCNIETL